MIHIPYCTGRLGLHVLVVLSQWCLVVQIFTHPVNARTQEHIRVQQSIILTSSGAFCFVLVVQIPKAIGDVRQLSCVKKDLKAQLLQ